MRRFTVLPFTLFRIQLRMPVVLRDKESQMAKNRTSFDLKTHTAEKLGVKFHTPNGMSLRPKGENMARILYSFNESPQIFMIQGGSSLPDRLIILHEHTDHYSLQVKEEMPLDEFNNILAEYLKTLPSTTKEAWLESWEDLDDRDN